MWVGVSKSLGNGFRIGTAVPLGSGRSRAASAKASADAIFVSGCQSRLGYAFWSYALSHGICVSYKEMPKAAEFVGDHDLSEIDPFMEKFSDSVRLYQDTKKISQVQKERVLKAVYAIERAIEEKRGSSDLPGAIAAIGKSGNSDVWLWICTSIAAFAWPIGTFLVAPIFAYFAWRANRKLKPIRNAALERCMQATSHAISNPLKVSLELRKAQ